jgi:hypothetical protein
MAANIVALKDVAAPYLFPSADLRFSGVPHGKPLASQRMGE